MHHLLHFIIAITMALFTAGCNTGAPDNPEENNGQTMPETPETPLAPQVPEDIITDLTLVSYNVANMGHGGDRLDEIARFIKETGADFAGLNEVDSCNNRHGNDQMKDLAGKLGGWNRHFASAFKFAGGGYGNGALCNRPLLEAFTLPIPQGSGHEPRSVAVIETEDIVFCATHLDFGPPGEPSYEQAVYLNQWFGELYDCYGKPVILCGDFNTDPGTATINEMDRCWTRLSQPTLSWPSDNPKMCLDYFFCYKGAVPVEVLDNGLPSGIIDYAQVSDHLPRVVRIRIRYKAGGDTPGTEEIPVTGASVFGEAAGNTVSADPVLAAPALDAAGNVIDNVFDVYLGPQGGNLRIKDNSGRFWCLKEDGRMALGDGSTLPATGGTAALLLRLDFGAEKWDCVPIKVLLQPYKSEAKPIQMKWAGNGIFVGTESFCPDDGYSRYTYSVVCDRPDIVYAWVRGQGGSVRPVPEGVNLGSVIFGVEAGLMQQKVSATVDIYNRTQSLKKEKRSY